MATRFDQFEFEKVFRAHLKKRGMSQTFLAQQLHVHRATLSKWMAGTNQISFENVQKSSQVLQLTDDEANEFFRLAGYANYLFDASGYAETVSYEATLYGGEDELNLPNVFVAQQAHLAQLLPPLRENKKVLLSGYAGVGKSTLAKFISRQFLQDTGKRVLWVGVRSPEVQTIFASLLTPFNQRGKIANATGSTAQQIVRKTLDKADLGLIVIDNLNVLSGLESLKLALPKNVPVLITSRKQATNIDFHYDIAEMNEGDGLDLLCARAENGTHSKADYLAFPESQALCDKLDNHPFSLTAAGVWLRERKAHPRKLLQRLEQNVPAPTRIRLPEDYAVQGLDTIHVLIQSATEELTPLAKDILDVYGLLQIPVVSADLMAHLTGERLFKVEDELQELNRWNLMEGVGENSSRVHDLIHTWSQVNALEAARTQATLSEAMIAYVNDNSDQRRFLNLITDLPNILAFAEHGDDTVCEGIIKPLALKGFQDMHGYRFNYLELLDRTITIVEARRGADGLSEEDGIVLHHLLSKRGNAFFDLGEYAKAGDIYKAALALAYNQRRKVMLNGLVGKSLRCNGNKKDSNFYLEKAKQEAFRTEDYYLIGFALQSEAQAVGIVGMDELDKGNINSSIALFKIALKNAELHESVAREAIQEQGEADNQKLPLETLKNMLFVALMNKSSAMLDIDKAKQLLGIVNKASFSVALDAVDLLREAIILAKDIQFDLRVGVALYLLGTAQHIEIFSWRLWVG